MAELLARLVRRSQSGIAVVNRFGDVVLSNERAEALGAVVDARPDPRLAAAAERVAAGGEPCEVDLSPRSFAPGSTPQTIVAQVRSLGDGFVVVDATDTSAAVRLEAVRRDFVANVGHELKTPVGALAVLAEAVLDADDPDEVAHFATRILNESHRLGALVTELISLSRLQGADRLPELVRVDVDEVLTEALRRVRVPAEAASAAGGDDGAADPRGRFLLDAPSGLEVAGDRTLLVTALANLLENAVAYSPEGTPVSVPQAPPGRPHRDLGDRPRHRDRARAPAARVRALLPRRPRPLPRDRRHRAGPRDRQARRRQPRRRGPALEPDRRGLHVHAPGARRHRGGRRHGDGRPRRRPRPHTGGSGPDPAPSLPGGSP